MTEHWKGKVNTIADETEGKECRQHHQRLGPHVWRQSSLLPAPPHPPNQGKLKLEPQGCGLASSIIVLCQVFSNVESIVLALSIIRDILGIYQGGATNGKPTADFSIFRLESMLDGRPDERGHAIMT